MGATLWPHPSFDTAQYRALSGHFPTFAVSYRTLTNHYEALHHRLRAAYKVTETAVGRRLERILCRSPSRCAHFHDRWGALRRAIYTVWGGLILRCAGLFSRFRNRTASVCPETSIFPSRKAGIHVRFKQSPHILFCNPLPHALSNTQSLRSMRSAAFTPARLRISWTRQTHAKPRLSSGDGA